MNFYPSLLSSILAGFLGAIIAHFMIGYIKIKIITKKIKIRVEDNMTEVGVNVRIINNSIWPMKNTIGYLSINNLQSDYIKIPDINTHTQNIPNYVIKEDRVSWALNIRGLATHKIDIYPGEQQSLVIMHFGNYNGTDYIKIPSEDCFGTSRATLKDNKDYEIILKIVSESSRSKIFKLKFNSKKRIVELNDC